MAAASLEHERVYADIKAKISSGETEVGSCIPSTSQLEARYGVSRSVIDRAVRRLKEEGVLRGRPGKGVEVIATPEVRAQERLSLEEITNRVTKIRDDLQDVAERVGDGPPAMDLTSEVAALRGLVEQLYSRLGHPLPEADTTLKRRRSTGT